MNFKIKLSLQNIYLTIFFKNIFLLKIIFSQKDIFLRVCV